MSSLRLLFSVISLLISVSASATLPHETFFHRGTPTAAEIAAWSALPGTRSYLFLLDNPASWELELISRLRGADRIQVEVTLLPPESVAESWRRLASQGVELIGLDSGLPSESQVQRLNRIGFSRLAFVLSGLPGREDAARLSRLEAPVSLTFASGRYPRFLDRPVFLAIPETVPLLFSVDSWPWYVHMDNLNLLPHAHRLRIKDIFPPDSELEYLHAIRRLTEVIVDADFEPMDHGVWEKLGNVPVRWSSRDHVPPAAAIAAFERSAAATGAPRRLVIDMDRPLTAEERARLERTAVPVEWIHTPPNSYSRSP